MLFLRQVPEFSSSGTRFPWNTSRGFCRRTTTFSNSRRNASEEYEFDPDKTRESLRKLDEQLQSLSTTKQINPPKNLKAPYKVDDDEKVEVRIQPPILNESFLTYTTFVLLAFTIFYNVFFATVIKPSIDGPDEPEYEEESSLPIENPAPTTRLDIPSTIIPIS